MSACSMLQTHRKLSYTSFAAPLDSLAVSLVEVLLEKICCKFQVCGEEQSEGVVLVKQRGPSCWKYQI